MLIYQYFCREDIPMFEMKNLSSLVARIVRVAYPELNGNQITIEWGRITSFATVTWNQDHEDIRIKCSKETKQWHEAPLTGLLTHELSHPAQKAKRQSEQSTDLDVVERGFGPYLGVERLFTGKYEDYIIQKGKDRYLGYRSIRNQLSADEVKHLDVLLKELRLVPKMTASKPSRHHDIVVIHSSNSTEIKIGECIFELPLLEDPDVTVLNKGTFSQVLVNGDEIGVFGN